MHGFGRTAACLALALVAASGLGVSARCQTYNYSLGQGLNVGAFNIAGYATIEAEAKKSENSGVLVDDLSLFIRGSINRWVNPFIEAELAEADLWFEGTAPLRHVNPRLDIERLYNDFVFDEHVTFRVGKMLSPVGDWNSIHAGPLVWTTTRPLTSYRNYPEFVTGFSAIADDLGDHSGRIEAYWQPSGDIDGPKPPHVAQIYRSTAGLHAEWSFDLTDKLGISLQKANIDGTRERQIIVGINGRMTVDRFELESELTWTTLSHPLPTRRRKDEYAGYVQAAFALSEQWYLIGRGETFSDRSFDKTSRNFLLGLNFRPRSAIAWKLEYVKQSGADLGISSGLFASFNILF